MSNTNPPNGNIPQQPAPPVPPVAPNAHPTAPQPQPYSYGGMPPQPPMGQQPGYPVPGPPQPVQPKGLAVSALVVGIASLVLFAVPFIGFLGGIVAVVLGIVALKRAQSKGMSITGIITGGVAFLASVSIMLASFAFLSGSTMSALDELQEATEELEGYSPAEPEESTEPAEPEPEPEPADLEWTTIAALTGNADQQSDTITLSGGKVRVTYEFADNSGYGTILGAIYLLKEGTDLMTDGGIPEVMVTEEGSGDTILRKSAGDYYVKVMSANANYTVTIEEQK